MVQSTLSANTFLFFHRSHNFKNNCIWWKSEWMEVGFWCDRHAGIKISKRNHEKHNYLLLDSCIELQCLVDSWDSTEDYVAFIKSYVIDDTFACDLLYESRHTDGGAKPIRLQIFEQIMQIYLNTFLEHADWACVKYTEGISACKIQITLTQRSYD